ncbi:MAG: NAD(P)H-hydrate epimerase [Candidatus Omnitrophica bacterium]|nr:NAD(P)H-hydrate epimerase [Candidatus Omnitrophota bacterium]
MRYVTIDEMKAIDCAAIKERGIPAIRLMENAGRAVFNEILKTKLSGEIAVFCGYGNNGGDGFVIARLLIEAGRNVWVFLAGTPREMTDETQGNLAKLTCLKHEPVRISDIEGIERLSSVLSKTELIVDSIFGIGIRPPLDEFYIKLIETINASGKYVISVDVPSGLDADTGKPLGTAVKAKKTVTMGYPKIGFRSPAAAEYMGELIVARIGLE